MRRKRSKIGPGFILQIMLLLLLPHKSTSEPVARKGQGRYPGSGPASFLPSSSLCNITDLLLYPTWFVAHNDPLLAGVLQTSRLLQRLHNNIYSNCSKFIFLNQETSSTVCLQFQLLLFLICYSVVRYDAGKFFLFQYVPIELSMSYLK